MSIGISHVRIILSHSKDLLGILARYFGVYWTHAAIRYGSVDHRWRILETSAGGTVDRPWPEFLADVDEYTIYDLKPEHALSDHEKDLLIAFAKGNIGKPYNYWWLLKVMVQILFKLRKPPSLISSHVCSTFIYACYLYVGRRLTPPIDIVLPDDIAASEILEQDIDGWRLPY